MNSSALFHPNGQAVPLPNQGQSSGRGANTDKRSFGTAKLSKNSVRYEANGASSGGKSTAQVVAPKRGGSARPIQGKGGIIMGSSHGITTQVPPKNIGSSMIPKDDGPPSSSVGTQKNKRGESPMIKTNNLLASGAGGASASSQRKSSTHGPQGTKLGSKYNGGVPNSGPASTKAGGDP